MEVQGENWGQSCGNQWLVCSKFPPGDLLGPFCGAGELLEYACPGSCACWKVLGSVLLFLAGVQNAEG